MKSIPIACPCSLKSSLTCVDKGYLCNNTQCEHNVSTNYFTVVCGKPILISETRTDTVCSANQTGAYIARISTRYPSLKRFFMTKSPITNINCQRFIEEISKKTKKPKILIIGGGERGSGTSLLWENEMVEVHSLDIYPSESVDIICDAHYLPLHDESYDGVWIQAVLEHVVEPTVVVNEIKRVLRNGGVVYSETPFMQQVHEGAYDFTRFTVIGHRYLFKNFELIDMGGNGGANIVLAWSIRYFIWSLTRSRLISRVIGISCSIILKPFNKLLSKKSLYDASSGVFFMGKKIEGHRVTHKELITLYKGQF
jgi:SAM-dependent methyltransferase